jgi:hypothetical protein
MEFEIGAPVHCTDGAAGQVAALIADPLDRSLAHLAVGVEHEPSQARVVPVELVRSATADGVELACCLGELAALPPFHDIEFVPYLTDTGDPGSMLAWPYYGLNERETAVIVDRIPPGEIEIRRGDALHAADGSVGRVEGLVVAGDGHITHVLLQEGHLWGRKQVAVPIASVERIDEDGIHVRLSRRELGDLPEVEVRRPGSTPAS